MEHANETEIHTRQALGNLPTLNELSDTAREKLAAIATIRKFDVGTVLFTESEHHAWFYFVTEGSVRLDMLTTHCGRQTILSLGRGDLLAWTSIIGDGVMTATAVAGEGLQAVMLPADQVRALIEADSRFGYELMKLLAKSLSRRLLATRLQLLDLFRV